MRVVFLQFRPTALPDDFEGHYPAVRLKINNWNDYGFETTFQATLCPTVDEQTWINLGGVKIGRFGYTDVDPPMRSILTGTMAALPEGYFSLGQEVSYYEDLNETTAAVREAYAMAMRDIPMGPVDAEALEKEDVYRVSLLRSSRALEALDRGRALFGAAAAPVEMFEFRAAIGRNGDHVVPFDFRPVAGLPHRINLLVGVNGVGKTQLMARMAVALSSFEETETVAARTAAGETFENAGLFTPRPSFYGVVAISFSAFDDFELPKPSDTKRYQYTYCGIRKPDSGLLDEKAIASRIPATIRKMDETQQSLLLQAMALAIPQLEWETLPKSQAFYGRLSAGQRIVLNIICDLVFNLRKRTLVLLDEPETHLHPQLTSTLMSVLTVILDELECFAIVATHSPIVVQQVLARHVHVLQRIDPAPPMVSNPPTETFGENLSEIVRLVFDAVEGERGYQDVVDRLLDDEDGDVDAVAARFDGHLGLNARLYLESRRAPE
ncbi:AAA family ATPase [Sphingomonas sp. AR_OL41]|uniref:AAA family ATPase n=1 Tax=Sphingomonas sp. AR_OL41 TaxID=3042729 RepID=UPI0024816A90|nr:AAA family ATPase [Sphingomonas sp. AR_OL41]MDH7971277.1 AAA family ATPase [Sphingomonas sp. AR_OL41]